MREDMMCNPPPPPRHVKDFWVPVCPRTTPCHHTLVSPPKSVKLILEVASRRFRHFGFIVAHFGEQNEGLNLNSPSTKPSETCVHLPKKYFSECIFACTHFAPR